MSFRDEQEEMRREFERTMNAAFRSMLQPPLGFPSLLRPPPPFFPTPLAQDPFGTFPIQRPAPPSYIDVDADDSEEEMMRRALAESKRAEEERRRKEMEQEREIIDVDAMEDEEELLRQGLAASLEESTSSPVPEKMEGLEEEDEELQRALAASVSADRERRQAEEKRRQEELRKQQEERALSHQDSEVDADSEADLMQAIAASLEAEREAKKKREAEKQRQETALLEERVRNLVGDMHGIFNTKESDVPMPQAVPEGERRERLKRQAETDERQLLREQQDEEFRASLERDRLVEREKKRKEEQESRAKWEQERKEAEAKRRKEELERRKQERVDEMKRKATTLPEEPQQKDASAAELVCRLPTGKRVGRRFLKGAKLEVVKDWVDSVLAEDIEANWAKEKEKEAEEGTEQPQGQHEAAEEEEKEMFYGYDLVSDFPRKTFSDLSMTIEQAGLAPRALISVAMH